MNPHLPAEPRFSYLGTAAYTPPPLGAGYGQEPYPLDGYGSAPAPDFETHIPFGDLTATASQAPRHSSQKLPAVAHLPHHGQGYAGRTHLGYEMSPFGQEAGIAAHHGAIASASLGTGARADEQQFRHLEEAIQLEMEEALDYRAEPAHQSATAPHSVLPAHSGPSEDDALWDPELTIAIFMVGCCLPPILLYNLLFCNSSSTTARIMARLSQMMLIFFAIIFVMVMAVVTATDSW
eukprot:GGOE01065199.1.p1 GENE.GGOE01065199.1~~GGOE01065199.1.p1  ORF type:complete len:236 (+),score=50.48 GGOE01065199.1:90-797(+)